MQAVASPCSAQVRVRYTFDGVPVVFHTSAGTAAWHVGQREVVCLSVSLKVEKIISESFEWRKPMRSFLSKVRDIQ